MASRKIEDLHPNLQPLARRFSEECEREGVPVMIYRTYCSNAEQDELYAKGRTKPGPKVTNAKGGKSDHNFTIDGKPAAKAFDAVPMRGEVAIWNDPQLWAKMGEVARRIGLKWGGDWKSFKDQPHFYI